MTGPRPFSMRIERDAQLEMVVLSYKGDGPGRKSMEACVVPAWGSNLCRFTVDGSAVIDFVRSALLAKDFTGTPVLYPTPNRVRNGVFCWQGREYRQTKSGTPVLEHGLVHSELWQYAEPVVTKELARLSTWIDFREGTNVFEAFPFPHRLTLEFLLSARGLTVRYAIRNDGDAEIPFGFGLHPYFTKLSGDEGTFLSLQAAAVMKATADLLPTGELLDVEGTLYDLRRPLALGSLDLDHVFTRISPGARRARIEHRGIDLAVNLETSEDFSHIVVYSPKGESFFCVENQTCSTDAHNLFSRGLAFESGLKTVPPRQQRRGAVTYAIESCAIG